MANESTRAAEVGFRHLFGDSGAVKKIWSLALWGRNNSDVIRIEKITATKWRAKNAGAQSFRGIETRFDIGDQALGAEAAMSYLRAQQVDGARIVPRVPMWQAAGGPRWRVFDSVTFRTLTRYVGRMYDDSGNTREIKWTLTHDVSADFFRPDTWWKAGISVTNVTNVVSTSVTDTVTGQEEGRMAYADFNGQPLTGRAWVVSASASL